MKVITSLSQIYLEMLPLLEKLEERVDTIMKGQLKNQWHYESRIKKEESFALKMETGRISEARKMEDFFACTIVVENYNAIDDALIIIKENFDEKYRRPKSIKYTIKNPDSFPFDDLRIYVKLKEKKNLPTSEFESIIFEIQIKTYLQYAWYIATHDLIYKSADISWSKQRIAYQIKAILENAELTIGSVDTLSESPMISKNTKDFNCMIKCKNFIEKMWEKDDLPDDMMRLSKNVASLLQALRIPLAGLKRIIQEENSIGRGAKTKNLSPYLIILKSIYIHNPEVIDGYRKSPNNSFQLYIPKELEIDNNML